MGEPQTVEPNKPNLPPRLEGEAAVLFRAVDFVCKTINRSTSLPILGDILVRVGASAIELIATDLEETAFAYLPHDDASLMFTSALGSAACVNGQALRDALKGVRGEVTLRLGFPKTELDADGATQTIYSHNPLEFPPLAEGKERKIGTIPGLLDALDFARRFASREENRGAILMGVNLLFEGEKLTIAGTDGYRMGVTELLLPEKSELPLSYTVHHRPRLKGDATLVIADGKYAQLEQPDRTIRTRLVDGQYPNWRQVLPKSAICRFACETSRLLPILERATKVAGDKASMIHIEAHGYEVWVTAESDTRGKFTSALPSFEHVGGDEPYYVAFNGRLLTDIIKALACKVVVFECPGPLQAHKIYDADRLKRTVPQDRYAVLMPLRCNAPRKETPSEEASQEEGTSSQADAEKGSPQTEGAGDGDGAGGQA